MDDDAAARQAEAARRERERAAAKLAAQTEREGAAADKERARIEREHARAERDEVRRREAAERDEQRRRADALKEEQRRQAQTDRQVRDADREAARAELEASRAATDAELAARRAGARVAAARARAEAAGLVPPAASGLPPGYAALWRAAEPGRRGPRPGLTVDAIAAAAIALADAEGLVAVSMSRVAEALGVTTMALYRYVGGKEDLLAVMYDQAVGPPPDPTGTHIGNEPGLWRIALEAWCHAQLAGFARHPWLGEGIVPTAIGPNRLAWIEAGLAALAGTPLTLGEQVAVFGRVSLHMLAEAQLIAAGAAQTRAAATASDAPPIHPALVDYGTLLATLAEPELHPHVIRAVAASAFDADDEPAADPDGADLGLRLMLDGVAALIAQSASRAAPPAPA